MKKLSNSNLETISGGINWSCILAVGVAVGGLAFGVPAVTVIGVVAATSACG